MKTLYLPWVCPALKYFVFTQNGVLQTNLKCQYNLKSQTLQLTTFPAIPFCPFPC